MATGLRLRRVKDAVGAYERLGNLYQRCISSNVDGIRSTIRFLGTTNEKIRGLKAGDLVDEHFLRSWNRRGAFNSCAVADDRRKIRLIAIAKTRTNKRWFRTIENSNQLTNTLKETRLGLMMSNFARRD
jgi:hypothetical protein